jgi:hypothetical protein
MITTLQVGEGSASRLGRSLPPGKNWCPLYRRLGGLQGRSGQVRKISPPTGIRSPGRPARSQSTYRLRYPAHRKEGTKWILRKQHTCSCLFQVRQEKNHNTKTAEKGALLGHYVASSVNFLQSFRENLFVPSFFFILDPYRGDREVVPQPR